MSSCLLPVILPRELLHSKHTLPTPGASHLLASANAGPSPGKPSPTSTFSSHSLMQQRFMEHPPRARNISAGPNTSWPFHALWTASSHPPTCACGLARPSLPDPGLWVPAWFPFTARPRRDSVIISMHPRFQTRCLRCTVSPKCRIPGSGEEGPRRGLGG